MIDLCKGFFLSGSPCLFVFKGLESRIVHNDLEGSSLSKH